jgi:AraC-like DNA-binding protein
LAAVFLLAMITKAILLFFQTERLLFFFDRDMIFIYATFFVWLVAYHVLRNEDAFRTTSFSVKSEDLEALKNAVHRVMKEKKAFKNPHLTLTEFADVVNIKPHLLSKVINECYRQNFRDFVNKYRVEEFIELARQDSNRRYTFLALANEVGFNSKSTFNAAFKKVTHRSPREFFKSHKMLAE